MAKVRIINVWRIPVIYFVIAIHLYIVYILFALFKMSTVKMSMFVLFFFCRESDRQGVEETAQQTAKGPEKGTVRGREKECRKGEAAKEPEEEEGG